MCYGSSDSNCESDYHRRSIKPPSLISLALPACVDACSLISAGSNNPCLFSKAWFNEKIRDIAFNGEKAWTANNMVRLRNPRQKKGFAHTASCICPLQTPNLPSLPLPLLLSFAV